MGETLPAPAAAARLAELAEQFMERRVLDSHGGDDTAAWHVRQLSEPLTAFGPGASPGSFAQPGARVRRGSRRIHHPCPRLASTAPRSVNLTSSTSSVIITPWRGVLVPKEHP
ncbi:hypothetical protein [Aeromicrobium sp. UC242_57]|uniref:hypothetical protein n=1 Tax=Aeromicrobium sp. UC242_57 TaxID=3374624 RepID=UPI0037986957